MPLGKSSECSNEHHIGYSPISYFTIGILEISFNLLVVIVIFRKQWLSWFSQTAYVSFILPIYLTAVVVVLLFGFLIGIDGVIGIYPSSFIFYVVKWFVLRAITDSLTVFFAHPGIGLLSLRRSLMFGCGASAVCAIIILFSFYAIPFKDFIIVPIIILALFVAFHAAMVLLPSKYMHRRPAVKTFSFLNALLLSAQISVVILLEFFGKRNVDAECAVEMVFAISEFLQLIVIINAFADDSMFWQGWSAAVCAVCSSTVEDK
jgi:hypothetical protein